MQHSQYSLGIGELWSIWSYAFQICFVIFFSVYELISIQLIYTFYRIFMNLRLFMSLCKYVDPFMHCAPVQQQKCTIKISYVWRPPLLKLDHPANPATRLNRVCKESGLKMNCKWVFLFVTYKDFATCFWDLWNKCKLCLNKNYTVISYL